MIKCTLILSQVESLENAAAMQADFRSLLENMLAEFEIINAADAANASADKFLANLQRNNGLAIIVGNFILHLQKLRTGIYDSLQAMTQRMITDQNYRAKYNQINNRVMLDVKSSTDTLSAAIDELQKLQYYSGLNIIHILKVLSLIKLPGLIGIEFTYDYKVVNYETLLDIEYPMGLVPEEFNCNVLSVIMTYPILTTASSTVDLVLTKLTPENPYTRQAWPTKITPIEELREKINLFMQKVEWLYIYFQTDKKYKLAYSNQEINAWVQNNSVTYAEFIRLVISKQTNGLDLTDSQTGEEQRPKPATNFVIYGEGKQPAYPVKYIYDLFLQYKMLIPVRPSKNDYEKLVRKLAVAGDVNNLRLLLRSPILEALQVNIYAANEKGMNVLDLLQTYRNSFPGLIDKYTEIAAILDRYKTPTASDIPSWSRGLYRAKDMLPTFNSYSGFAALSVVGAFAAAVYLNSESHCNSRPSP
jgi:hypothetical protein